MSDENENVMHNYANQWLGGMDEDNPDADVMRLRAEVQNDMRAMMYNHIDAKEGIRMDDFVDNIISHENTVFGRDVLNKETDGEWIQKMVTDICDDDGIRQEWFN